MRPLRHRANKRRFWWLLAPGATLALTLVLSIGALLVAATGLGWRFLHIETGSMEPTFPTGSLAVVAPVDPAKVHAGMPITFAHPDDARTLVTHRVIAVIERPDGRFFKTQGDANPAPDPQLLPARNVRGEVKLALPNVGRHVARARGWPSAIALIGIPGLALAATEVTQRRRRHVVTGRLLRDPDLAACLRLMTRIDPLLTTAARGPATRLAAALEIVGLRLRLERVVARIDTFECS